MVKGDLFGIINRECPLACRQHRLEVQILDEASIKVLSEETYGSVRIADEVVSIIASLAASEVKGVYSMVGSLGGGLAEMVGKRDLSKGVKASVGDKETAVDLCLVLDYGVKIPDVAAKVQKNVKKALENMTGLDVVQVNIHVQGVKLPHAQEETENKG